MKLMKSWSVLLILILSGCTGNQVVGLKGFQTRNAEEYYRNSGVVQYFLSELPAWANSSDEGMCRREIFVRYLDMKALRASYRYSYDEALQFQFLFNLLGREKAKDAGVDKLRPQDEEVVFFETSNRIQSGFFPFRKPKFERVSLIWVDPILSSDSSVIKKILSREEILKGHPVVISNCLGGVGLRQWLFDNGVNDENIRLIPAEIFSPYDIEGELSTGIHLDTEKLFGAEQKVYFYTPKGNRPKGISGKFIYRSY